MPLLGSPHLGKDGWHGQANNATSHKTVCLPLRIPGKDGTSSKSRAMTQQSHGIRKAREPASQELVERRAAAPTEGQSRFVAENDGVIPSQQRHNLANLIYIDDGGAVNADKPVAPQPLLEVAHRIPD